MRGGRALVIGPWPFNPSSPAYSTTGCGSAAPPPSTRSGGGRERIGLTRRVTQRLGASGAGSPAALLPDCCLCAPYVLPIHSHVDRIHMGVDREYSRDTQGAGRRYVGAPSLPTMRERIYETEPLNGRRARWHAQVRPPKLGNLNAPWLGRAGRPGTSALDHPIEPPGILAAIPPTQQPMKSQSH